jgi:hypothetical protein
MNIDMLSVSSGSITSYETDNTTAQECLDDMDTNLYVMSNEIDNINISIDKLINDHCNYNILSDICAEAPSENYFEYIYNKLKSISLH